MTDPRKNPDIAVAKARGRPMLTWVGKKPLARVTACPAQGIERLDALSDQTGGQSLPCPMSIGATGRRTCRKQAAVLGQTGRQGELLPSPPTPLPHAGEGSPPPCQPGFSIWRVNDYHLQIQHNETVEMACEHLGVTRTRTDSFFDGTQGSRLVNIASPSITR